MLVFDYLKSLNWTFLHEVNKHISETVKIGVTVNSLL